MSGLPKGWESAKISDVFDVNPGHKGLNIDSDLDVSFIPMTAIEEITGSLSAEVTKKYSEVKTGYTKFLEDDVVFAKITPCMENGKIAIAQNLKNGVGCGTTELHVFRPFYKESNRYLLYFLLQDSFRETARQNFQGTSGHLRVPISFFDEVPFPLPPLNEQRRIVAKLEEVLAKVNASQKRLARIPVILKRFRQAVLAAACSGRLTADWREENKVDEWEWSTLSKQDVSVQTGPFGSALHKHDYVSNGVPLVNPMHIRDGQIHPKTDQSVSENKLKELTRYLLLPGDIVLGRRGEMGRAAVVQVSGLLCGTGSLFLRATSKKIVPEFLCLQLRSPLTCAFLEDGSVGSTMTNLNQQIVGAIEFPIVGNDEQQEIVRRVESFFTLADQLEARYQKAKTHVDKLTQSILAKAFRGELVPQNPSDEPASELLARKKNQCDAAPAPGKKKVLSKKQATL